MLSPENAWKIKVAPKVRKSTDHDHNPVSSNGGQDTLAGKISGNSFHVFCVKYPETPSLARFTKSKLCQNRSLLGSLNRRPIIYNLFQDWVPVGGIYGYTVFKWVSITWQGCHGTTMINSLSNGSHATCLMDRSALPWNTSFQTESLCVNTGKCWL